MKTCQVTLNGISISYLEENPSGDTCLLYLHGNSHNKEAFISCLNSKLLSDFRHIAVDLPGHGESGILPNYSLHSMSAVLKEFIESLQLRNIILVGHSLGGHLALQLTQVIKPGGMFIFGTPPAQNPLPADAFLPHPQLGCFFQPAPEKVEVVRLFSSMQYGDTGTEQAVKSYWSTDPNFRSSFPVSVGAGEYHDELQILKAIDFPLHMLICSDDPAVNNDYVLRMSQDCHNDRVSTSEIHAGHAPQIQHPHLFNFALAAFTDRYTTYFPYSKRETHVAKPNAHR